MATKLAKVFFGNLRIIPRHLVTKKNNTNYVVAESYATSTHNKDEISEMKKLLKEKFPLAKSIVVDDISGGCGDMYEISVESVEFKGLTVVKQHRLVNEALKEYIKDMHGIVIHTTVPPSSMR